jgi:dTDP-4-dehydrorhamnose 3,5-epimerase-like enzyme
MTEFLGSLCIQQRNEQEKTVRCSSLKVLKEVKNMRAQSEKI